MSHVTSKELQSADPKKFQKEYSSWAQEGPHDEWWEYTEDHFKKDMDAAGVYVREIQFSLGYSQSDYAGFEGEIRVSEFMETAGYDVEYPALYLAVKEYGDRAHVVTGYRIGSARVSWDADFFLATTASGVFKGLDDDAWEALLDDQHSAAGLEAEMQSYVAKKCTLLYRDLQDAYEHLTSEESFIEHCECNEVTFEIEGETDETFA